MQHVVVGDKSLLLGDEVADLLLRYAAMIGRAGSADSVEVHAIDPGGDAVTAGLLLNSGTALVTETSRSGLPAPENAAAESYLRQRLAAFDIDQIGPFGLGEDAADDVDR